MSQTKYVMTLDGVPFKIRLAKSTEDTTYSFKRGKDIAINLQTSFLTPPFGFALFYLRGVAPASVTTAQIYRGVIPFVAIQLLALLVLALVPELATWLPQQIYSH